MLYHKRGKQNRNNLQHLILRTIAATSLLSLADIAESTKQFGVSFLQSRKSNPRYDISRGVSRLIAKGYLKIKKRNGKEIIFLTTKGEDILAKIKYGNIKLKTPKRWDGKWRVVIYDIKEERKRMRGELKEALVNVGFAPIQKSVWVYPYPCEDLLAMLKADFKVGKEVLYLVVDKLENDGWIKHRFKIMT